MEAGEASVAGRSHPNSHPAASVTAEKPDAHVGAVARGHRTRWPVARESRAEATRAARVCR
jgi:hypothetical protein